MRKHVYTIILLLFCIMAENQLRIQLKIFQSGDNPGEVQPALLHSSAGFSFDEGFVWSWNSDNNHLIKKLQKTAVGKKERDEGRFLQHVSGTQMLQKTYSVEIDVCLKEVSHLYVQF